MGYGNEKVLGYKIVILFLLLGLFLINTASAVSSKNKFSEDNDTLIIKSPASGNVLLAVQQISVKPDLVTMEEIFKITAYENYTFKKNKDFNIRWKKHEGRTDITGLKWEILEEVEHTVTVPDYIDVEKNKTISNILTYTNITDTYDARPLRLDWGERHAKEKWSIKSSNGNGAIGFDRYEVVSTDPLNIKFFWNVTERIGSHQEAKYSDEWRPFSPDGRTINKNQSYNIKLTLYKQAETGNFSIKTIPMFAGIEDDRFTWWNGSWNYYTGNPIPNSARPYQLSLIVNNSEGTNNATHVFLNDHANINFTDIRFTLDNATPLPYWIEDNSTGRVWVNITANGTVNLYYGNPSAIDSRDGERTFEFFDDFSTAIDKNPVISPVQPWESGEGDKNRWGSIALVNGTYYIYFTNNTHSLAAIGRATSTDLITWTRYANNPVIKNAIGPSLLKELNGTTPVLYNGKYWMSTMASDGSVVQIRSAANIDSDTWVIENNAALLPQAGTWYSSKVFTNSFTKEGSTYYLVFQGYDGTYWRIGYATASAPGGPYAVQGILLESTQPWEGNATIDPELRKFGDTYYIFYTGGVPPVPYNNSYATSTSLTGSYTKSLIQLTPLQHTYPAILVKDSFYYILDDDQTTTGKDLYKRADLRGAFGSLFKWKAGGSPTVSGTELLLNADREYLTSNQAFLYKAMKIKAKFAPLSADNSYQYMGFSASDIGSDYDSGLFVTTDTDILAHSGNSISSCDTSIGTSYLDSYHNYEILWGKGETKFIIDDVLKATHTACIDDNPTPAGIYDYATAADFYVDWIFIRNYASPEPVWSEWTPEQVKNQINPIYTPPSPVNLISTQGNFWINYTWQAGAGAITDSYNVSVNDTWTNGSKVTYLNASVGPHGWGNISVWAYNNSGLGNLSSAPASQSTQVANNAPVQAGIGNKVVTAGDWLNFTVSAADADSD
ncbi:MAG: DUF2341 domain-containing protein, partial [Candidatus Methanoperedens sp.]|nr:DUF2341 domain-containing protein [Candidatus Methanoperedens sp.]